MKEKDVGEKVKARINGISRKTRNEVKGKPSRSANVRGHMTSFFVLMLLIQWRVPSTTGKSQDNIIYKHQRRRHGYNINLNSFQSIQRNNVPRNNLVPCPLPASQPNSPLPHRLRERLQDRRTLLWLRVALHPHDWGLRRV